MQEAIKRAIKGGYKDGPYYHVREVYKWGMGLKGDDQDTEEMTNSEILLDPTFWQAISKAEGWQEEWKDKAITAMIEPRWRYEWHRFIDKIASGGTPDEFFKDLLGGTDL